MILVCRDSNKISFRKGQTTDIKLLESIRVRSIEHCINYSSQELNIWKKSTPDWKDIIGKTIICEYDKKISGFVSTKDNELHLLYVDPSCQNKGIGNELVSLVESKGMRCDTNSNSERILIKRGWEFDSDNIKTISGETFNNKWYIFKKNPTHKTYSVTVE